MSKEDWKGLIERLRNGRILSSQKVIKALCSVPRESFLPENMQSYSATDTPLPIGFGQTVSAPHSLVSC